MNLSFLPTDPASSWIERDDVLDASIVFSSHVSSRSLNKVFLISRSSNMTSITMSASFILWISVVPVILDLTFSACSGVNILRWMASSRVFLIFSRPRWTKSSWVSINTTSNPSWAIFWAIPLPIFPAPIIPTFRSLITLHLRFFLTVLVS